MTDPADFLTRMSHELRTPINSVLNHAELLLRNQEGTLTPRQTEHLRKIEGNGQFLLALLNDVVDLTRIEAGRIELREEEVELPALIQGVVRRAGSGGRSGPVKLSAQLPPEVLPLRTDAGRLNQVLRNLVGNALKFTRVGKVVVRLEVEEGTGRPLAIVVSDTGPGIPADRREVIFDPFRHAGPEVQQRHGGTGLGLTLSRALCELMGYELEVESRLGEGSTFTVHFHPTG